MDSKINWIILVLFSPFDTNEAKLLVDTFERMDLIRIFVESQQYIIAATWDTYESKFEKTKKIHRPKNSHISGNGTLFTP